MWWSAIELWFTVTFMRAAILRSGSSERALANQAMKLTGRR
jgi:hypothetical protein